jgi:hypothetical protein
VEVPRRLGQHGEYVAADSTILAVAAFTPACGGGACVIQPVHGNSSRWPIA